MGLLNELLDVLEAEDGTVLDIVHSIETLNTIEENLNLLALVTFVADYGQQASFSISKIKRCLEISSSFMDVMEERVLENSDEAVLGKNDYMY